MDIEKLKAEFEQTECFKRLEHVAQYTFFEFGAYIKRTDVPADIEKKCGKLITALLFSWSAWKEAKAQAVPEYAEFYLGNGLFAVCDWCDFNSVKSFKWNSTSLDNRVQWAWAHDVENGGEKRKKVAMHNVIMRPSEGFIVDHINGNGLDNRRSNLRIATRQQNTFNSVHKGGTSKYKGVALDRESGLWRAYIAKDGKRTWLGRFPDELSAAIAYDKAAKDMFGEYAKLNIATAQEPAND